MAPVPQGKPSTGRRLSELAEPGLTKRPSASSLRSTSSRPRALPDLGLRSTSCTATATLTKTSRAPHGGSRERPACTREPAVESTDLLRRYLEALTGDEPRTSLLEIHRSPPPAARHLDAAGPPLDQLDQAAERILELAPRAHVYVGVAPRVRAGGSGRDVERLWSLWADCDTPEAVARMEAFQPAPAIIVESGSGGAHGYWPLVRPLSPGDAARANRRLARTLGAEGSPPTRRASCGRRAR